MSIDGKGANAGPDSPTLIAISGGKGGAGRSTIALALACASARSGREALLVDADTASPVLHALLGEIAPPPPGTRGIGDPDHPFDPFVFPTSQPKLALMTFATSRHFPFVRPKLDAPSIIDRLKALTRFDDIILDLPAGHDPICMALLVLADIPVFVVQDDLLGYIAATQHLRAALFHGIGFHPDCFDAEEELLLLMRQLPLFLDRDALMAPFLSVIGRRVVRETCANFVPEVILNKLSPAVTQRQSQTTSHLLGLAWRDLFGVFPRALGHAPWVDGFDVKRDLINPGAGSSLTLAARAILHGLSKQEAREARHPRPILDPNTPDGLLGMAPGTGTNTDSVLASLIHLRDSQHSERDTPVDVLLPPHRAEGLYRQIRLAVEILDHKVEDELKERDKKERRELKESVQEEEEEEDLPDAPEPMPTHQEVTQVDRPAYTDTPEPRPEPQPTSDESGDVLELFSDMGDTQVTPAPPAPPPLPQRGPKGAAGAGSRRRKRPPIRDSRPPGAAPPSLDELAPRPPAPVERTPRENKDAPTPGTHIKTMRRERGMSMRELSLRTKIGIKYLQAIESTDHDILPRPVYLRGYLREIAQVFDIDDEQLIEQYLQHLGHPG